MELNQIYQSYKPLLFSIAYRMCGSVSDAEDIVHDVLLTFSETVAKNVEIENVKSYLCKMITNKTMDFLKSARKKREVYVGPWLPEPLLFPDESDPLSQVLREDHLSYALLHLLEQLTPVERAIFILREAFDYSYTDIGEIVEKNEANCRKILSRVKQKLQIEEKPYYRQEPKKNEFIQRFIYASSTGNMEEMLQMLSEDIVLYSDGGGKVLAAIVPIVTRQRVYQFLMGITKMYATKQIVPELKLVEVNGQLGVVAIIEGKLDSITCFAIGEDRIQEIYMIRNPDKLKHIALK